MSLRRIKTLLTVSMVFAAVMLIVPSSADAELFWEGCTPGFWKTHPGWWPVDHGIEGLPPLAPNTPLCDVFMNVSLYDLCFNQKGNPITLMDALKFKGGKGELGAARIFLRHSVAALLNLVHQDVSYRGERSGVHDPIEHLVNPVDMILSYMDRQAMLRQADLYDSWNNWYCPLGGNKNR